MNNITIGRIYKITSPFCEKCYIGSTRKTIKERFKGHKNSTNNCASKELIKLGEPKIELLEEVNNINNSELRLLEQKYINENNCINKIKAVSNKREYDREFQRKRRRNMKSSWITL